MVHRQSGLNGDFAARSRAAALTEAAALISEEHTIRPLSGTRRRSAAKSEGAGLPER